jgi:sugar/nucleoside kinase (ribokinase family)
MIESPAFEVVARDTTGAGDVFHAAFVWGLIEGMTEGRILQVANGAAAMSCRALGAQGDLPTREELERFLRDAKPRAGLRPADPAGDKG